MDYNIVGTGSDGNAVIIGKNLMIDCGLPWKYIQPYARDLSVVLLTHIHGDHFNPASVRALLRERPALRWGCCEWMVRPLLDLGADKRRIDVFEMNGRGSSYGSGDPVYRTRIIPVKLDHDVPNCGWKVIIGEGAPHQFSVFYATDTGYIDGVEAPNYDLYLLEANHTEEEIASRITEKKAAGEFAYEERAAKYHLSKDQAEAWLVKNMGPNSRYVFLHGHKDTP